MSLSMQAFKNHFSLHCWSCESVDINLIGFQSWIFWGLVYHVQVLKVGVPKVGFTPFTPHGEAQVLSFLLIVGHHTRGRAYGETVSQPFLLHSVCVCVCFLVWPI